MPPFWGRLSDSIGRKKVLIIRLIGSSISYVMLAFAETLTMVIISRVLSGLMAGNISIAFAYVADITDEENRSAGLGKVSAALGLGFMTGPAIGGFLAGNDVENANYVLTALSGAAINVIALIGAVIFLKESLQIKIENPWMIFLKFLRKRHSNLEIRSSCLPYRVIFLLRDVLDGGIFPLWANQLFMYGPSHIGSVFFMLGLISVIIQGGLIGPLTKWIGEIKLVQTAAILMMIGLSLIGSAISTQTLWIGLFFYGCGAAMFNPSLSSLVSKSAKADEKGLFLGQYQSACAMGRIRVTFSGILFSQVTFTTLYRSLACDSCHCINHKLCFET